MFRFSDFSWPKSVTEEFPKYNLVLDYIKSYAEHFGLTKYIRLNTRVLSIEYEGFSNEEIEGWTHWGGSGDAFSEHSKWRINIVDSRTNVPLQVSFNVAFLVVNTSLIHIHHIIPFPIWLALLSIINNLSKLPLYFLIFEQ